MTLVSFHELMEAAGRDSYAVGYFESWNLESLLAVADAAERTRSPVILGFSGIYLPHPARLVREPLSTYAAMGLDVCHHISVPCCLLFNESPVLDWVLRSVDLGFNVVMYADEKASTDELVEPVRQTVAYAHRYGAAVEAEMASVPGLSGGLEHTADAEGAPLREDASLREGALTDPYAAAAFVEQTGIDALAISIGQVHLHGRKQVALDLGRLAELRHAVSVPLVLHGATSVRREDLARAAMLGMRKINVGSVIKRSYFEALRTEANAAGDHYTPYDIIGSGFASDVLTAGRVAMQAVVEDLMHVFGSAGKA
ncbi:MAG: class II fructose-bisphosphate aldolase [Nitrososphaerales archaeon]